MAAKCNVCDQEMKSDDCTENREVEYADGTKLPSSTYHFSEPTGRCHDCNIKHGNYHHPGCDVERCPRCKGQIISCDCEFKDSDSGETA